MAKGKSSKRAGATISRSLTPRLPRFSVSPLLDLRQFEDRRFYHPLKAFSPPAALRRSAVRVVDRPKTGIRNGRKTTLYTPPGTLTFAEPTKVILCVRRKRRKEVLFAKNKAGKSGKQRKPRRNYWSSISCKR